MKKAIAGIMGALILLWSFTGCSGTKIDPYHMDVETISQMPWGISREKFKSLLETEDYSEVQALKEPLNEWHITVDNTTAWGREYYETDFGFVEDGSGLVRVQCSEKEATEEEFLDTLESVKEVMGDEYEDYSPEDGEYTHYIWPVKNNILVSVTYSPDPISNELNLHLGFYNPKVLDN